MYGNANGQTLSIGTAGLDAAANRGWNDMAESL